MSNILSWVYKKLKQRERHKHIKIVSRFLTTEKFDELEAVLGFQIKDKSHYVQALMHRSFMENFDELDDSNERLEFLGDSVLSLVVAEYLFEVFPNKNEGFLTKVRAKLVNRNALAEAAEQINLSKYLLVSENLSSSFTNASKSVLSDALEALIGAIYLDHGVEVVKDFINRVIIEPITKDSDYLVDENYKSQLLEYSQANKLPGPNYSVVSEEGPQHNRIFTIRVSVGKEISGTGKGRNKKSAEQNAAKDALKFIKTISLEE